MGANTVASSYMNFKRDTLTPPFYIDGNRCLIPSSWQYGGKDSGRWKWGFFSASTTKNEATGQRPEDITARSGIDHLSVTRRTDHLPRRASVTPGRTTEIRDLWRPVMKAGRVVINEQKRTAIESSRGTTLLEGRGAWPSVLSTRQRSVLDKSVLISLPDTVHLLQV